MPSIYCFQDAVYRLLKNSLLVTSIALAFAGCAHNAPSPTITTEQPSAIAPEFIPVTRYGRYTLVELAPTAAQQDLLLQVVDASIPNTLYASVGDGLRHVLQRSGYQLCSRYEIDALNALPLPAAHYQLGPLVLRDALLTLVGPAWDFHIDQSTRQVCFTPTDVLLLTDTEEVRP